MPYTQKPSCNYILRCDDSWCLKSIKEDQNYSTVFLHWINHFEILYLVSGEQKEGGVWGDLTTQGKGRETNRGGYKSWALLKPWGTTRRSTPRARPNQPRARQATVPTNTNWETPRATATHALQQCRQFLRGRYDLARGRKESLQHFLQDSGLQQ